MEEDLKTAVEIMRKGGVILYPTDTIWGHWMRCHQRRGRGQSVQNQEARQQQGYACACRQNGRCGELCGDSSRDGLPAQRAERETHHDNIRQCLEPCAGTSWRQLQRRHTGAREVFTQRLCKMLRKPIVSTSANIAGEPSPAFFDEISDEIKSAVDYIVKYRQDDKTPHAPSSVVMLSADNTIKILRP